MERQAGSNIDFNNIIVARTNVLHDIQGDKIACPKGTILIGCSDGDRFWDMYNHHCEICNHTRNHPLSLNGGALLISKRSPIRGARADGNTLLRHAHLAVSKKGFRTIILYVHTPCLVANTYDLDFLEVLRLLIEAKMRLRSCRGMSEVKMYCFFHVDYEHKKRTYFVARDPAIEFLASHGRPVREQ